jgi:uncharacterized Zn-binding protein involved in type VI secretion
MVPNDTAQKSPSDKPDHGPKVTVEVNGKPVALDDNRVTGLEIKQAAIAQGVEIELEFILVEETKHGGRVIGDTDTVTVNKKSRFTANADDDNS